MTETWWSIFSDPNHIIAELLWTVIQDVVLVWFVYGIVIKKIIFPKFHIKFDKQHGLTHIDDKNLGGK